MPEREKKRWARPMLTVLVRGEHKEEHVLGGCKMDWRHGSGPDPLHHQCSFAVRSRITNCPTGTCSEVVNS